MGDDFRLRRADPSDAARLCALSIETWLSTYAQHGISDEYAEYVLREFSPERFRDLLSTGDATILLAETGPFIGGYTRFAPADSPQMVPYGEVEITTLYIRPAQKRLGLGQALLRAALSQCAAYGAASVFLKVNSQNSAAIAFYQAMGMEDRGPWTFMLGSLAVPNRIFSCPLGG